MAQQPTLVLDMLYVILVNALTCVTTNERTRSSNTVGSSKGICGMESMFTHTHHPPTPTLKFLSSFVLFNRQPSLHKMSMMSHRVRLMPYSSTYDGLCHPHSRPDPTFSFPAEPFRVSSPAR